MAIVLHEIQFPPPAQAQVAGQAPPSGPGGPAQAPGGPPAGGSPPAGCPSTSGQGAAQQGNNDDDDDDDDDDDEEEEDDDPYNPDDEYQQKDEDDDGNDEPDDEEEKESTDYSHDDSDEYDEIYYDANDDDDEHDPGEYDYDNDDLNDETNLGQKRKCESPVKEVKKHKTGESSTLLQEHEEGVETIVEVPREHEIEEIPQEESLLSPELSTPHRSHVQDMPPRRHSPHVKDQTVTEPIAAMPLEFVHPGTECKAARIETPQNPSSERNQRISRKLFLGTPLGANPQQSTSTGGENVKTIPPKGPPKTGQCGHGCGHGAPSAHGHGAAPAGAPAPFPVPPVPGVVTHAATATATGGGGGGGGAGASPVRNVQYIYRSPLVIVEVEGKKVSWDHNKYAAKAFCAMACGLAFALQGYIVHVFPDKVDVISTCRDVNDMTIKCEAEHINMQRDDQNLATQFDTLTARLVEILVKQFMTTATTANLSFAESEILALNTILMLRCDTVGRA